MTESRAVYEVTLARDVVDVLNLGCGTKPVVKDGWNVINHDRQLDLARPYVKCAWDLDELPWPWEDESRDLIVACAVLEHLRLTLIQSVDECWRVLRPGGVLHLKLPMWNAENSYIDPTHFWQFTPGTLDVFDPDTRYGHRYAFYTERKWTIVEPARINRARTSFSAKLQVRK